MTTGNTGAEQGSKQEGGTGTPFSLLRPQLCGWANPPKLGRRRQKGRGEEHHVGLRLESRQAAGLVCLTLWAEVSSGSLSPGKPTQFPSQENQSQRGQNGGLGRNQGWAWSSSALSLFRCGGCGGPHGVAHLCILFFFTPSRCPWVSRPPYQI